MKCIVILIQVCCLFGLGLAATPTVKEAMDAEWNKLKAFLPSMDTLKLTPVVNQTACNCGVFLSGQFKKGSSDPPVGVPTLMHEQDAMVPCTLMGHKQCSNKCLETIAKHLPNSPVILCGSIDRDVYRERAYLFVQNCNGTWVNTNFSAGREFCCKDGSPYKCPNNLI
ncbi:follicle cell protein 3C-1 [Contarinia nasturtii]|uniref:follicle cell protein 3C-1 n=1 Tax=Contarinia nasturtii TaxID=265458 RepID=UPI0012D3F167|nr:follicle cell protein 3C-1 [Contarinia nasturtii]